MELHVIYVFVHDIIAPGQDGPTHQPVEPLAGLRVVPDPIVARPADAQPGRSFIHSPSSAPTPDVSRCDRFCRS